MLNHEIKQPEIAVRLYDNNTYGTTYGRGLYRKAIYNGTIDAKQSNAKYLVDFYNYEDWANQEKTDGQMEILANVTPMPDTLFSWVAHYDGATKSKTPVTGVCLLNASTMDVRVVIMDAQHDVVSYIECALSCGLRIESHLLVVRRRSWAEKTSMGPWQQNPNRGKGRRTASPDFA